MLLKFNQMPFGMNEPDYNNTAVKNGIKPNGSKYYYTRGHVGEHAYQYEVEEIKPGHWSGAYKILDSDGFARIGVKNITANAKKMLNSYIYMLTVLDEIPEAADLETFMIDPINNQRVISIFRRVMKGANSAPAFEIEKTYGYRYKGEVRTTAGVKFLFEKIKNVENPVKPYFMK